MSLNPCDETGEQLDANVTCGALCADFPGCLPPPSPALTSAIGRFSAEVQAAHDGHQATARTLGELHDAITEGLAGREQQNDEDCD